MRKRLILLTGILLSFVLLSALTGCADEDAGKTYMVSYNHNGATGANPATQTVSGGSSITLPSGDGLFREAHSFGGWNTNAHGTGDNYAAGEAYKPVRSLTLYAKWDVGYTVSFNANGAAAIIPPRTAEPGAAITLPGGEGIAKPGSLFAGWNTKADGTGNSYAAGSSYTPDSAIILYVQWDPGYTVTYLANGGRGVIPASVTVPPGVSVTIPSGSGFSRSGYTFKGWNTGAIGEGNDYAPGLTFTPDGSITLYAKWLIDYFVRYDINRGKGTLPIEVLVPQGESITLPGMGNLNKIHAEFNGWNTSYSYTATPSYAANSSFTPTGDVIFYVNWKITTQFADLPTLAEKLAWHEAHNYGDPATLYVDADETIEPTQINWGRLTLVGRNGNRTISLGSNGPMFEIGEEGIWYSRSVVLILGNNITLKGRANNTSSLVKVNLNTGFVMENGSAITGNHVIDDWPIYLSRPLFGGPGYGGAVYVANDEFFNAFGTFVMQGGEIYGNAADIGGGGVYVGNKARFDMNGGEIYGNTVYNTDKYSNDSYDSGTHTGGGGVFLEGTYFVLTYDFPVFNKRRTGESYGSVLTSQNYNVIVGPGTAAGGTIYGYAVNEPKNNLVKNSDGSLTNSLRGHGVFCWLHVSNNVGILPMRTERLSGPTSGLYINNGRFSGDWEQWLP